MLRALSAVANDEYLNQIKAYLTSIGGLTNIQAIADGEYQFPDSERRTSQISIRSTIWTLYTAFVIFIYTLTSCLLGMARSGKTGSYITLRLLTNLLVGALTWYLLGYAFSFGRSLDSRLRNRFIGNYTYALHRIREENHNTTSFGYAWFIQAFCYALVCNNIVSEALGLKATVIAHAVSSFYVIAFVYPVIAHWVSILQLASIIRSAAPRSSLSTRSSLSRSCRSGPPTAGCRSSVPRTSCPSAPLALSTLPARASSTCWAPRSVWARRCCCARRTPPRLPASTAPS